MQLFVHEVIEKVSKEKSREKKIQILKENDTGALRDLIRGTFDDRIIWLLPQGSPPPYNPNKPESTPSNLIRETRNLAYLVKGGPGENFPAVKREKIFINMLEAIHPNDALLLLDMINKKAPKGLTKALAKEAFPMLFPKEN